MERQSILGGFEPRFNALGDQRESEMLSHFTPEQQIIIRERQKILSSLALFIGKDFKMPVELNEPGQGWHWDFEKNIVRIDPVDLLEKPMEYLRFVISHEGGHRRISRTDFIPLELWNQPGFPFLMNVIEDPRTNNFVAESYPRFKDQMSFAYGEDLDIEKKAKAVSQEKLGYQPKFVQAGFEYIRQWFRDVKGEGYKISEDLPDDVQAVISKTLAVAEDAWLHYPSRTEADKSEDDIRRYAKVAFEIIRDAVWPEYRKLIEEDMKNQELSELLKQMQEEMKKQEGKEIPKALDENLSEKDRQELQEALEKAIKDFLEQAGKEEGGELKEGEGKPSEEKGISGKAIPLDSLSDELKEKLRDFIDSLPQEERDALESRARTTLQGIEKEINEELEGKLSETPNERTEELADQNEKGGVPVRVGAPLQAPVDFYNKRTYRERTERRTHKDENVYEKNRREVLPLIDKLEMQLRQIFVERTTARWKSGYKSGKRIDIKKRIGEKARKVSAVESEAWQKRDRPEQRDYAITLLVDLSGSMRENGKISETFKAVIVLAEVLNRLGVSVEIIGFNDEVYEYQNFGQPMSKEIREHMGGMFKEVEDSCCKGCGNEHSETDLGWATEIVAERLIHQKAEEKFLITLSDGKIAESRKHPSDKHDMKATVKKVLENSDVHIIGLGVGKGTKNIETFYPQSIADIDAKEMAEQLAKLIKQVIANTSDI